MANLWFCAWFHAALTFVSNFMFRCFLRYVNLMVMGVRANDLGKTQFPQMTLYTGGFKTAGELYLVFVKGWGSSCVPMYIRWLCSNGNGKKCGS